MPNFCKMAYSDFVVNIHTKVNHSNSTHGSQSVIYIYNIYYAQINYGESQH